MSPSHPLDEALGSRPLRIESGILSLLLHFGQRVLAFVTGVQDRVTLDGAHGRMIAQKVYGWHENLRTAFAGDVDEGPNSASQARLGSLQGVPGRHLTWQVGGLAAE